MEINVNRFLEALPLAGIGMLGVFVVIVAIFICVKLLTLIKGKDENQ